MRLLIASLLFAVAAGSAAAQGNRTDFTCSPQLLAAVVVDMPIGTRDLDPRQLSCLGLTQVYFITTSFETDDYEQRQRVRAVFPPRRADPLIPLTFAAPLAQVAPPWRATGISDPCGSALPTGRP